MGGGTSEMALLTHLAPWWERLGGKDLLVSMWLSRPLQLRFHYMGAGFQAIKAELPFSQKLHAVVLSTFCGSEQKPGLPCDEGRGRVEEPVGWKVSLQLTLS